MMLLRLVPLAFVLSLFSPHTAFGEDSVLGKPYVQKPLSFRVDYKIDPDYLTLQIVAEPAITACGNITDVPLKASFDFEAADITVGDYMFLQPMGTGARDCRASYKAASANISIDRGALVRKDIRQLRLWYQYTLDTFTLQTDQAGNLSLMPPMKSRMFKLGRDLNLTARPVQAPDPIAAPVAAPQYFGPVLILTTGNAAIDAQGAPEIAALAATRGLAPQPGTSVYTDTGGQFALQLQYRPSLSIGSITVQGARYPVIARLAQ